MAATWSETNSAIELMLFSSSIFMICQRQFKIMLTHCYKYYMGKNNIKDYISKKLFENLNDFMLKLSFLVAKQVIILFFYYEK